MADAGRSILISGDFTEAEFAEVCALLRRLDDARPDARFQITVHDPNASLGDAEEVLKRSIPKQEGRRTNFTTVKFPKPH